MRPLCPAPFCTKRVVAYVSSHDTAWCGAGHYFTGSALAASLKRDERSS